MAVVAVVLLGTYLALPCAVAAQARSQGRSPAVGGPYLIIGTQNKATMERELNSASAAGYRVVLASNTGGTEKMLLLKKSDDPEPVEYLMIATDSLVTLQEEMNAAASRGFRLHPGSVIRNPSNEGEEILLLFKKDRNPLTNHVEYNVTSFPTDYVVSFPTDRRRGLSVLNLSSLLKIRVKGRLDTEAVDLKLAELAVAGFQVRSLVSRMVDEVKLDEDGDRRKLRVEIVFLLEKSTDADTPDRAQRQLDLLKRYHVMTGVGPEVEFSEGERKFSEEEFDEMLNNAAMAGYRMLAASPMAFPEMVVLVEKNPTGTPLLSYRVLMTMRMSTLRKELLASTSGGWLPHPRGLLDTGGTYESGAGQVALVTERIRNSVPEPSDYLLLATTRTSTLEKELSEAARAGFEVVIAGSGRGEVVIVLKRAKAAPARSR